LGKNDKKWKKLYSTEGNKKGKKNANVIKRKK
jgi:hypothetical protein